MPCCCKKPILINPVQKLVANCIESAPVDDKKFLYYLNFITTNSLLGWLSNVPFISSSLLGATMQGYYKCPPQRYIAENHKTAAYISGAVDGVVCCLIQMGIYNSAQFLLTLFLPQTLILNAAIFVGTTFLHAYIASETMYMCAIEALFVNACQNDNYIPTGVSYMNKGELETPVKWASKMFLTQDEQQVNI